MKKVLSIKSVSFRSSIPVEKFQHVHIEASADVPQGTDPSTVVDRLKVFVAAELRRARDGQKETVAKQGRFRDLLSE